MPIYEYRCRSCGFEKEYLQKLSDAPITDCPGCGKAEMGKLVSAAGFQLKGSGWYVTDFKNNGTRKDGGAKDEKKEGGSDSSPGASKGSESSGGDKSGSASDQSSSSGDKSAGPGCGAGACPACQ